MSNDIAKNQAATHDFTQEDLERIEKFKEGGCLGLAKLTDVDITRMMDHYLNGKSYREISKTLRIDRTTILYLSQKLNWFGMRKAYIEELGLTIRDRVLEAKLRSQEFLLGISFMLERKIGRTVEQYLRTESESDAVKINLKEVDKYLKIVDGIHRLQANLNPVDGTPQPLVGVNPGAGVNIRKIGENEIEITPSDPANSGAVKSRLRKWADLKRDAENQEISKKRDDIRKGEVTPNGEEVQNDDQE